MNCQYQVSIFQQFQIVKFVDTTEVTNTYVWFRERGLSSSLEWRACVLKIFFSTMANIKTRAAGHRHRRIVETV
jgi:hypothetical protein